jgi:hypothetical protein
MAKRPPKWDGTTIIKEIDAALDRATAKFLKNTQSKLSAASPVLTGRLASSWNIGKGQPDLSAPPVRETKGAITQKPFQGQITYGGMWYISSNLPYTQRAVLDPYNGRRGGGDWFSRIENRLQVEFERTIQRELSQVKGK